MAIFYVDGEYLEESEAKLPLSDLAILRGYAVFDFLRTYNGRPFHLEEHLHRLKNSAALLFIKCPWELHEITTIVTELLTRNQFQEANLRIIITGGDSLDSITPLDQPRLIIMASPLKAYPTEWYRQGVKIITSNITRYVPGSKSTDYIRAIMALRSAREQGAIESIYVNNGNQLLEGTTSNIFAVVDGEIITPEEEILPGITREVVVKLAESKYTVKKQEFTKNMLPSSSEIFITSSNREVVPVVQIDETPVSSGPGPITKEIIELFRSYTQSW